MSQEIQTKFAQGKDEPGVGKTWVVCKYWDRVKGLFTEVVFHEDEIELLRK